jgi:hypothetical protein
VASGKFLRYLVTQHEIEANLDQIATIIKMKSTKIVKDIQSLKGETSRIRSVPFLINRQVQALCPGIEESKRKHLDKGMRERLY